MSKKKIMVGGLIGVVAAGALVGYFVSQSHAQSTINIPNGDLCKAVGRAATNGNITQAITGYSTVIAIGGNNGTDQVPALELATSQAENGYGPGDYIFTPVMFMSGAYGNEAFVKAELPNFGFTITDITHPLDTPTYTFWAGSDVTAFSGYTQLPNPYSNPDWYGPGQYVHLAIAPMPHISTPVLSTQP